MAKDARHHEVDGVETSQGGAAEIAAALRLAGKPERAVNEKRYLKSSLEHYGASVPAITAVVKEFLARNRGMERGGLLSLVRELWERPVHETRMAAVELLCRQERLLESSDIGLLERLLRESRTWALVDPLAIKVVGPLVRRYPRLSSLLDRWSHDDDFWLRRTVLLSYLLPLRHGDSQAFTGFGAYADAMLEEREFFIRKAIGWVLREYSKKRPDGVFEWLLPRVRRASGLTFREGSKHLPEEQRRQLAEARAD